MNVYKIDKALLIIRRREMLADKGKGEMQWSEYRKIKRLLNDFLKENDGLYRAP